MFPWDHLFSNRCQAHAQTSSKDTEGWARGSGAAILAGLEGSSPGRWGLRAVHSHSRETRILSSLEGTVGVTPPPPPIPLSTVCELKAGHRCFWNQGSLELKIPPSSVDRQLAPGSMYLTLALVLLKSNSFLFACQATTPSQGRLSRIK